MQSCYAVCWVVKELALPDDVHLCEAPRRKPPRVGIFGVGLDTYWPQFDGLKPRLEGYLASAADMISKQDADVINFGLVDNVDAAFAVADKLRQADLDLLFVYATTYALSSTVLPIVQRAAAPVILLNLQPTAALDYDSINATGDRTRMTAEWLAYCGACPIPEFMNVLSRSGITAHQVTGVLNGDPHVESEVEHWVEAAGVVATLRRNRLGLMGRYYGGMLDIYTDITRQVATFGGHVQIIEVDELTELRRAVTDEAARNRVDDFYAAFDVQTDCDQGELLRAARTACALDMLVSRHQLGAFAYYAESAPGHENEDTATSLILGCSLLTARGVPAAGEYEVKNAYAMKIMDAFGAGGSFSEYYAIDFNDDVVLFGHDGPGHIAIAEGRTKVRPLQVYHGKVGKGLSVEMSVRQGAVTLLSVVEQRDGSVALLYCEGESVAGPILEIGNTNSRYRFPMGARRFVETWNQYGPAHHCAIGTGHIGDKIEKLAALLGIRSMKV